MKKVLLFLSLFCSLFAFGQTSTYLFSRSIGTYTNIAGAPGTVATTTISGEDVVWDDLKGNAVTTPPTAPAATAY